MNYYTYYVNIPLEYDNFDLEGYMEYIMENYPDIYKKLKFGDLVENGNESGYRSNGLYIVDEEYENLKLSFLSNEPDDYGTIPLQYEGFIKFDPGFHFETTRDLRCISYFHNNYAPINLLFLLNKEWKSNKLYKNYCEFIYNNKNYITISNNGIADLLSINEQIIYGNIYTTRDTIFDNYKYDLDLETDEGKFLNKYDKILFI